MSKHYHFIGIGGIGMSGLARFLLARGYNVSGSDIASSYVTEDLMEKGAEVYIGHAAHQVAPQATVIYSSDIKTDNPELLEAKRLGCRLMHRSDLLLDLMSHQKTLSIAGTHGKTTTSSLLAEVLTGSKLHPSFAVGGIIKRFQSNAEYGKGDYFVAEADESDGTFLKYDSFGAIITNIDLDHMNHYGTEDKLIAAFGQFASKVASKTHLLWCRDDERLTALKLPGLSYGFHPESAVKISNARQEGWRIIFDLNVVDRFYKDIEVSLIGVHNVLNAAAVFALAIAVGASEELVRKSLADFHGVKRRCEKKGDANEVLILDDYAHHPTEVKTTLEGIRKAIVNKRLITIFQPHRYSRTQDCLGTYGSVFKATDELIITEIFSAGETPIEGVTHEKIIQEIQQATGQSCKYIPRKQLLQTLPEVLKPNDVIVTLGAGDITKFSAELAATLI